MTQFSIDRRDTNGVCELTHAETIALALPEAMLLIEHLGWPPSHTDNDIHAWYGQASTNGDAFTVSRPFVLTVDGSGRAQVRIDTLTYPRLFARALASIMPAPGEIITVVRIGDYSPETTGGALRQKR